MLISLSRYHYAYIIILTSLCLHYCIILLTLLCLHYSAYIIVLTLFYFYLSLFRLYLVFQEMRIAGVEPDAAVYNTLINACAGKMIDNDCIYITTSINISIYLSLIISIYSIY